MRTKRGAAAVGATVIALGVGAPSADGAAQKPRKYKNCDALNRVYPHGVGLRGARALARVDADGRIGGAGRPV